MVFRSSIFNTTVKWDFIFVIFLFLFLWTYLIIRANTVFYIHDEVVSKWRYMVSWNPLPYHGYIDANNHFINSLLGGFFIRLFKSDAMWIIRLPSLLSFPLFFWSIYGLRNFFNSKINFYSLLIALTCSSFIIEYFGLARGYGISIALLVFAMQQTIMFYKVEKINYFIAAILAWTFSIYVNLTLIPFALVGFILFSLFLWKKQNKKWITLIIIALFPLGYAVKYSFYLKQIGKLYLGEQDGIIDTTLHSLTPYLWNTKNTLIDVILITIALFILFTAIWNYVKSKDLFEIKLFFPIFFVVGVLNILFQNWLLGINFPEDRAALYLVIFFFGGLCFTIDYWNNKWLGFPFILLTLILFGFHINLNKLNFFYYEHFDVELLTKIPAKINGIPPSVGGIKYYIDYTISREKRLPLRAFQDSETSSDTLDDYIITRKGLRPDILNLYHPIYKDQISETTLFKRNNILPKKKMLEQFLQINGENEYYDIYNEPTLNKPLFLRCSGVFKKMSFFKDIRLIFSAEDTILPKNIFYNGVSLTEGCAIQENGEISFDFTFAMNNYPKANKIKVYVWNKEKNKLLGKIKLQVYKIQ